jgi:hypothetical protein
VNKSEIEKLQTNYTELENKIITTGFQKLSSSNIEKMRKLNNLKEKIKKWK